MNPDNSFFRKRNLHDSDYDTDEELSNDDDDYSDDDIPSIDMNGHFITKIPRAQDDHRDKKRMKNSKDKPSRNC